MMHLNEFLKPFRLSPAKINFFKLHFYTISHLKDTFYCTLHLSFAMLSPCSAIAFTSAAFSAIVIKYF